MHPNKHQLTKALDHMDVLRLRRDGHSIDDIALKMRTPPVRIHAMLNQALSTIDGASQGFLKEVRALEVARLDEATKVLMPKVSEGDMNAVHTLLKVMGRRASLLGLDAPKEVINRNFDLSALDVHGITPEQIKELTTDELKVLVLRAAAHNATDADPAPEAA